MHAVVAVWLVYWELLFNATKSVTSVGYAIHPRGNYCSSVGQELTFIVEVGDQECVPVFHFRKGRPHE